MRRFGGDEIDVAAVEKSAVLLEVAAVGFDGVGRGAALDAEHLEECIDMPPRCAHVARRPPNARLSW